MLGGLQLFRKKSFEFLMENVKINLRIVKHVIKLSNNWHECLNFGMYFKLFVYKYYVFIICLQPNTFSNNIIDRNEIIM